MGIAACIALVISCFLPWVYYADLDQHFTGFYSYKNEYGKPGKLMFVLGIIAFLLMLLPKLWAKRINLFITALGVGYAVKTYILFTSCYNNYCPEKLAGIYLMLAAALLMLMAAVFPEMKLSSKSKE